MKPVRLAIGMLLLLGTAPAIGAEWQPAKGPLMTRWAKDVSPEKAHPEYPRPQMVRKDWLNLNGLWQLAFAKEARSVPAGKDLPEQILVPFPVESALSGVMKQADRLWYRRHLHRAEGMDRPARCCFTSAPSTGKRPSGSTARSSAPIAAATMRSPSTSPTP